MKRSSHGGESLTGFDGNLAKLDHCIPADVNDAWYPPSDRTVEILREALGRANCSPEVWGEGFRSFLSRKFDLPKESIVASAGASPILHEVISNLFLGGGRLLTLDPTYSEYGRLVDGRGGEVAFVDVLNVEPEEVLGRCLVAVRDSCEAVVLCNPNNPSGRALPYDGVIEIIESAPAEAFVLIDETYIDYTPSSSVLSLVVDHPRLVVVRSFSKSYALAGLRVGFCGFGKAAARLVRGSEIPWRVGLLAEIAARSAVEDSRYMQSRVAETCALRDQIQGDIAKIGGLEPLASDANFFLVKVDGSSEQVGRIVTTMCARNIFVRQVWTRRNGAVPYLRIATRSPTENHQIVCALAHATESVLQRGDPGQ